MTTPPYRRALVTGATSGIGWSLALWLAARGIPVVAAGRRGERLEALRAEAARTGGAIEPLVLDVAEIAATRERVRELDGRHGDLDLVVANAGVGHPFAGFLLPAGVVQVGGRLPLAPPDLAQHFQRFGRLCTHIGHPSARRDISTVTLP